MSEPVAIRRKRLIHRSRYRGSREADLLFGRFADRYVPGFDDDALDQFEALIEESDQDLLAWIMGRAAVPERHRNEVYSAIERFSIFEPPA